MRTDSLRINQLSDAAYAQYLHYLSVMDAKDVESYVALLADDCTLQMNNKPPVNGKQIIRANLAQYWHSFRGIEHELLNIYGSDENFALEALNHYVRLDGKRVTVNAVAFTDKNENGLVKAVRLYSDVSPVFGEQ